MIQIYNEDCLEGMKRIPDKSVDMILADLPYGVTAAKWDCVIPINQLWEQYKRVSKPNAAIVLFGVEPFSTMIRQSNIQWYKYDWIWHKTEPLGFLNAKKQPLKAYENIMVFYNKQCSYYPVYRTGKPYQITRKTKADIYNITNINPITTVNDGSKYYPINILTYKKDKRHNKYHPTAKPVALLEYLIKTYTLEGETILDNTMGSGSTGVAAVNLNRSFIGFELDKNYFAIAKQRIEGIIDDRTIQ